MPLRCSNGQAGGKCDEASGFTVDAGTWTLVGPSNLDQDRTCVSGRTCSIDGITGNHLSAGNQVMVMDTCGEASRITRLPAMGIGTFLDVTNDGALVSWGAAPLTAAGGYYRLCWCAGLTSPTRCSTAEYFRTDMGRLTIVGVSPLTQHRTCVSGQACALDDMLGMHLSTSDQYVVLETCGLSFYVDRFALVGLSTAATASGANVQWGSAAGSAAGGRYRLCWCSNLADAPCEVPGDFIVDAGELTVVGPAPLAQFRTCVSGQTCSLSSITGQHLSVSDQFMLLDSCGAQGAIQRLTTSGLLSSLTTSGATVSWGTSSLTAAGGIYRLCWCANLFVCDQAEDFRTDLGEFTLIGPRELDQDRTCVSGQTCKLDGLLGQHLSLEDHWLVLDTCGLGHRVPRFAFAGSTQSIVASGARVSWGAVAPTAAGGEYRLCWCAGSTAGGLACSTGEAFRTDLGRLTLIGSSPLSQDRTCVSGQSCRIEGLLGQHLDSDDHVVVLDTCGLAITVPRFATSGILVGTSSSGAAVSFGGDAAVSAAGGQYRLCWCSGSEATCSIAGNARVDMGRLLVVGPDPLNQDRTCVSGQTCELDALTGYSLMASDSFMVLDTCGTGSTLPRFPSAGLEVAVTASGSIVNWGSTKLSAAGGLYRLCWCAGVAPAETGAGLATPWRCSTAEDFRTDMGEFTIQGVSPLKQDRTCVSGQPCTFEGITGQSLSTDDRFAVLETCGLATWVARFARQGFLGKPTQAIIIVVIISIFIVIIIIIVIVIVIAIHYCY